MLWILLAYKLVLSMGWERINVLVNSPLWPGQPEKTRTGQEPLNPSSDLSKSHHHFYMHPYHPDFSIRSLKKVDILNEYSISHRKLACFLVKYICDIDAKASFPRHPVKINMLPTIQLDKEPGHSTHDILFFESLGCLHKLTT